ncbi:MAG: hypothetical protein KDD50_11830, partial [Bdellovibrionales bacterium]|nr:hypothetical protein [Bdellovibrionales bacterium]
EFIELANFINQTLDSLLEQKQMLKNEEDRHRQSEQLLNIAKEETIRANEAKTRFLANMSHEFRTPLNSVIGFSQVLQRDLRLTESQRNHIKTIHKSGNHLLQLINDTLDLSKIEVGKMSIQENPFSISDLLKDLREMFKLNSKEKGVDLKVMIQGFSATDYFIGDNLKLKQVLINLVGNAIKFSESGVVKLRVRKSSEDLFLFEVIDQGPGMERPQLRDVFEPFSQGRSGELEGGTGLGLSISKKYVEFLGGQLKVKSVPEKGSKFYFIIKLEKASVQTKNHSKRNSIDSNDKPINIKELNVHQEILEELIIAAEMHNITLLKKLCKQLSKMKPDDQTLAREIEKLLKDYDLTAIQLLLQRGSHAA